MQGTQRYGRHRIVTKPDGTFDLVYSGGHYETWYTQRGERYYREEESTNVRNDGNALRRISRAKFEEIHKLITGT